ncbi:hypothetical protein [Formosa sp. PL04]|uniref:hypothetical protein n=1 Tax=Formosa sp. PL04 TaxID=3081755 RepID=UPI00298136C1|nr:hypothetical protein [Formosa sp. PL04]MDW5289250.1 hypothetical protein [Formosa sp. PL04]
MKRFLLIAILSIAVFSCDEDDNDCVDTVFVTTSLEEVYGCVDTENEMYVPSAAENTYTVITNQADFESQVEGTCMPEIDFEMYDLIIGNYVLTSGYSNIIYELSEDCDSQELELDVTFNITDVAVTQDVTYHVLTPKLENVAGLTVDIDEED